MENNNKSIFNSNINRGLEKGIIIINEPQNRITYKCSRNYETDFRKPEEIVRASYFVELVLDYKYPQSRIDLEVKVERRVPDDRADIVIYEDNELKSPYLVVETKRDGITDAEFEQAIEQAFGNANSKRAKYAIVVAGNTKTAFDVAGFKSSEREKNVISDIPIRYGRAPKYKFVKGSPQNDLKNVYREDLISALKKCQNTVWQAGKLAPTTAFDEVSKLLFCKLKDERITKKNSEYRFQIGSNESFDDVSNRIQQVYNDAKIDDPKVFTDKINLTPEKIYSVVEHLQSISLSKTDLDTKGVAFEIFMRDFFIGKMGQYFTPRPVVQFCVKILNPTQNDRVIDPSCGSGGFLLYALDNVRRYAEDNYDAFEAYKNWHNFAEKKLYGIEINEQIARVCKMNMIIHDDGHTNVICEDALTKVSKLEEKNEGFKENSFDIVLANPPFGATIKSKDVDYLPIFDLGLNNNKERNTQKSEILFVERCIKFARKGIGKIALVLPEGLITNRSLQYVRDYIANHCQILASISLPESAFSHFGAGIKSSVLILRRKYDNEVMNNYPIFMAVAKYVGISSTGREEENELYSEESNCIYNQWLIYLQNPQKYEPTKNCYTKNLDDILKEGPFNATRYIWTPLFKENPQKIEDIADIINEKIKPSDEENSYDTFAWIRMDEIQNNPVKIDNVTICLGNEIEGSLKVVQEGDVLLARLGPSMMNRKIVVVPHIEGKYVKIIASPEFIVIRPHNINDSFYITAVLRTDLMLKYMYSKTRGGTPSRYRLDEEDFKNMDFPVVNSDRRYIESQKFENSLNEYYKIVKQAETDLITSHKHVENFL